MKNLKKYGLNESFILESKTFDNLIIGRVTSQNKNLYNVIVETKELDIKDDGQELLEINAEVSGKFIYNTHQSGKFPTVGDFVMLTIENDFGIIHHLLKRKSLLERKSVSNRNETQPIAANIDKVFICMALNEDYNLRRLERYLSIAWGSEATPVIVLTKADLCDDIEQIMIDIEDITIGCDVILVSMFDDEMILKLNKFLNIGETIVFIGSSGVGKSTLINILMREEIQSTKNIRLDDGKGKHTTTRKQLFLMENGTIVIDTPGIREVGVESVDLSKSFSDIEELASLCKFNDCKHENEPDCAVKQAIVNDDLDISRYENYMKIKAESKYEGLSSREIENLKIEKMFSGKSNYKNFKRNVKSDNKKR